MQRMYTIEYIDQLLQGKDICHLVEIMTAIQSLPSYKISDPFHGLPPFASVFEDILAWQSQAIRSGVWTYYESTPATHQTRVLSILRTEAPAAIIHYYERGMTDWQDVHKIEMVDNWIKSHESVVDQWLFQFMRKNRNELLKIT